MTPEPRERWLSAFAHLVKLYPRAFRSRFARPLRDAFLDAYDARAASGRPLAPLLLHTGVDLVSSIVREHVASGSARLRRSPVTYAVLGAAHLAPFAALNAIIGARTEPFYSLIRPAGHTTPLEVALLSLVLLLLPTGAVVTVMPLWRGEVRGLLALNVICGLLLLALFAALALAFGTEVYRCDVRQIVDCD